MLLIQISTLTITSHQTSNTTARPRFCNCSDLYKCYRRGIPSKSIPESHEIS